MEKKILPCSIEAEEALLGVLLRYNNLMGEVIDKVTPSCFYSINNQTIFETINRLYNDNKGFDLTTVFIELQHNPNNKIAAYELARVSGLGEMSNLSNYVAELCDCNKRRQLWGIATALVQASEKRDSPLDEIVESTLSLIADTMSGTTDDGLISLRQLYDQVRQTMLSNRVDPSNSRGFLCGIPDIDEYGGFGKGTLTVLGGRPSSGKSALVMQWTMLNAQNGISTLFFTLEMTCERLATRVLANKTGVKSNRIQNNPLSDEELNTVNAIIDRDNEDRISDNVIMDSTYATRIDIIIGKIRRLHRRGRIQAVVIDYIQQMDKSDKSRTENETRILGEMSHRLQALARQLNIPIITTSQLNRNSTNSAYGIPRESDLRGSGEIEEAADNILLLQHLKASNYAKLYIAKNRNGEAGNVYDMSFEPERTHFELLHTPTNDTADNKKRKNRASEYGSLFD